jgi:hypothetical protein
MCQTSEKYIEFKEFDIYLGIIHFEINSQKDN